MELRPAQAPQQHLPLVCEVCHAGNPQDAAFCGSCGNRLPTPLQKQEEEAGRPGPAWTPGDIARALGIVFIVVVLLLVLGGVAISLFNVSRAAATLVISAALELVLIAVTLKYAVRQRRLPLASLGFRPLGGSGKVGMAGLAIGASIALVAVYGLILKALGFEDALPKTPLFEKDAGMAVVVLGSLMATLLAPLAEEMFFRGFVFGGLRQSIGVWGAALSSAGLFMVAHISPVTFIPIFLIGLILAWVYVKTGSLWYSILTHMGYNALVIFVTLRQI